MKMEQSRNVQYWVTLAVSLATMTSSVAFSWTTPVIPKIHNNETDLSLTDTELSWIVSSMTPGVMVGCLISRFPSDTFGRRATLLGSAVPFIIGTIFLVFATKAWMICAARVCWGLGSGIIQIVPMIYIAEIAAKEIRGKLSVLNRFMFSFGSFLVVTAGSVVSYKMLSYMLLVLPVCFFAACWWISESPYFLLKDKKVDMAKKALMKLNGYEDEKILEDKLSQMRSHVREETQRSGTFKELMTGKQYRKAIIISIGLRVTQQVSGIIPLQAYLGRILQETNLTVSVSTGLILYSALRLISSMLASFVIDKVGRRPLLIYSYVGASIALIALGILFYVDEIMLKSFTYFGDVTLFLMILFTIVTTLGYGTVNFVIPAEIFPLNVKSTAMTSLSIFIAVITFIIVRGYQILKDFSGMYGVFWFYGCFAVAGAVFSYFVVPETKGKSLREIQIQLQGDLYDGVNEKMSTNVELVSENKEMVTFETNDELTRLRTV